MNVLKTGSLNFAQLNSNQHPLRGFWPPPTLGIVPGLPFEDSEILESPFLSIVTNSRPHRHPSDSLVLHPHDNHLLAIWSAQVRHVVSWSSHTESLQAHEFLELPPHEHQRPSKWRDMGHKKYPSNLLFVRAAYKTAFSIFVNAVNEMQAGEGIHLALGGTSGLGKTFFFRYVIWRLLHPADMEGFPQTILLCPDPKGVNGYLYHAGKFYSVMSVSNLLGSDVGKNLFNHKNAWIISDGKPAPDEMDCPTLVISSPGNFQNDDVNGTKEYFKNADCKVFLPPWTEVEIWAVAQHVFNLGPGDEDTLKTRFERYGGVPRAIFNKFREALKPFTAAFALTNVTDSLNSVGEEDINHQFISGTILHLIPSKTLQEPVRYEWASTAMMEGAFDMMFKLTRHQTECFLHGAMGIHVGTFYGLLFEPYFHSRVTTQGYTGRMRKLSRRVDMGTKQVVVWRKEKGI